MISLYEDFLDIGYIHILAETPGVVPDNSILYPCDNRKFIKIN